MRIQLSRPRGVAIYLCSLMLPDYALAHNPEVERVEVEAGDLKPHGSADVPAAANSLTRESQAALEAWNREFGRVDELCHTTSPDPYTVENIGPARDCIERNFDRPAIARLRSRYPVHITPSTVSGVPVEIISSKNAASGNRESRMLINLHGGSFMFGGRWAGEIESIPIASVGKIPVLSVDYRMAPEFHFPAASEDVVKVYAALLKTHHPAQIGIYGCSAGGFLTAEALAEMQKQELPAPGAVGIFCAGVYPISVPYFRKSDSANPLAFPGLNDQFMAAFPPTLLVSGTKDGLADQASKTYAQLRRLGVSANLRIWEGMPHAFLYNADLPESREAYKVIANFFNANLK